MFHYKSLSFEGVHSDLIFGIGIVVCVDVKSMLALFLSKRSRSCNYHPFSGLRAVATCKAFKQVYDHALSHACIECSCFILSLFNARSCMMKY